MRVRRRLARDFKLLHFYRDVYARGFWVSFEHFERLVFRWGRCKPCHFGALWNRDEPDRRNAGNFSVGRKLLEPSDRVDIRLDWWSNDLLHD